MCGIAGIILNDGNRVSRERINRMTQTLAHRGPDGEGVWVNPERNAGLGHRRLAIIDLSAAGAQPMHWQNNTTGSEPFDSHLTITYNGEIYNYLELKEQLFKKGYRFNSHSDTEVILAAYDYWGEECLDHFDGMFSFVIWDEKEKSCFAARDRFGEKPFYYYKDDHYFIFASEIKAIWAAGVEKKVNEKMLLNYIALGQVQNANHKERTFYEDIYSLPPGHYLKLGLPAFKAQIHHYWSLDKEITVPVSISNAIEVFTELLNKSVRRRLRSDVTVGTSLSGGLDSSAIVATIQQLKTRHKKLQTFSAVFPGFEKDESPYIKMVVKKFQVLNFQTSPTVDSFLNDFQKLCIHQEEPFPSSSIYAQYKVFELAKYHEVKVLLDGQGADETQGGYHKYVHWFLQQLVSRKKFIEANKQKNLFRQKNIPFKWGIQNYLAAFFPSHASIQLERNEYKRLVRQPDLHPEFVTSLRGKEWEGIHKPIITKLNDILYFNTCVMGMEELLRFADRNSMAHGREVRLPFLSHELVEYIFSLPADFKMHDGWTKWLLRSTMNKRLPKEIVWRRDKIGYEPPQYQWMENEHLQEFIHESKRKLVNNRILKGGSLNKKIIPSRANDADNFEWRYMCAAQII